MGIYSLNGNIGEVFRIAVFFIVLGIGKDKNND